MKQCTSHDPTGLQLDALIGKLTSDNALSPDILVPLRAVQYYGNLGVHYQKDKDLQFEYVQACLYSLFGVMSWYFETYWPKGQITIPFPVSSLDQNDIGQAESFRNRNIGVRPKSPDPISPEQWAEASCTLLVQR